MSSLKDCCYCADTTVYRQIFGGLDQGICPCAVKVDKRLLFLWKPAAEKDNAKNQHKWAEQKSCYNQPQVRLFYPLPVQESVKQIYWKYNIAQCRCYIYRQSEGCIKSWYNISGFDCKSAGVFYRILIIYMPASILAAHVSSVKLCGSIFFWNFPFK